MTSPNQENQQQIQEQKTSDKELNFRNLEAKYQRELEKERNARLAAEQAAQEAMNRRNQSSDDDDDSDEPYVDKKRLDKKLQKFGQMTQSDISRAMEEAKHQAKEELKRDLWLEKNPDFGDVLKHAQKFAEKDPELADIILKMPDGFERQKLVYKNIKALGLHEEPRKESTIQQKIDANRKGPFYQPTGVGTNPYASSSDFSPAGQKNAYDKIQELKKRWSSH